MTRLYGWKNGCAIFVFLAVTVIASPAQNSPKATFTTLFTFDTTDGISPYAPLIQGPDGNFYGTTLGGGTNCKISGGCGTVFRITPAGKLTSLYSFCAKTNCSDGAFPQAGLLLANDGNFYGTTSTGGTGFCIYDYPMPCGTVFKITPAGKLTTLYNFCSQINCADGGVPYAGLTQGIDGSFYGATTIGGIGPNCPYPGGCGTLFRLTPADELTTLYNFCSQTNCTDGSSGTGMIQATDGDFFGTTGGGGANGGGGTVFRITPSGKLSTLHSFCGGPICADGTGPGAALVQAVDGNFYGTATTGGERLCSWNGDSVGCGTIFRITAAGVFTLLRRLNGTNGYLPSGLIQASDLNLYGTTVHGGPQRYPYCNLGVGGCGNVFKITPGDNLITVHNFCTEVACPDAAWPEAALLQATNGDIYGTTESTVFKLSGGLPPFIAFVQRAGRVGQRGGILGQGFTGTTGVFLNGTAASFTVVSDTYIQATVPVGATSGFVTVNTPSGTLTSNVPFYVIP